MRRRPLPGLGVGTLGGVSPGIRLVIGAIAVLLLAGTWLVVRSNPETPAAVSIERVGDGWEVRGLTVSGGVVEPDGDARGAVRVSPGDDRVLFVDETGFLSGNVRVGVPDLDPNSEIDGAALGGPLSWVLDRSFGVLRLAWMPVEGATRYEVNGPFGEPISEAIDYGDYFGAEVPFAPLEPGDLIEVWAFGPLPGWDTVDVLVTLGLLYSGDEVPLDPDHPDE